jgi:PEP-CTERM motif
VLYTHKILLLLISTLAAAPFSFASTVTWNLRNVTFSDAATASGTFDWNVDTNTLSNWNISVNAGVLSAFTYTSSNSTAGSYFQVAGYENELLFMMNGTTRQLRLTPLYALTNAGGTVPINLNTFGNGSGSVECYNCSPYREVVSGALMTGTPEPGAMGLLGVGLAFASLVARKRRNGTNQ